MKEEEFYEEIVPAKCIADAPDWEKFRREAAKDILTGLCAHVGGINLKQDVQMAIRLADELINQLQRDKEK